MDDEPPTDVMPPGHGGTEKIPAFAPDPPGDAAPGLSAEDDDWPIRGPARGIRLALPAAGLVAVLLVGAGFWGGATLQKHHGSSSGGGGGNGALASRLRSVFGATGATGARGATGGRGTTGTNSGFGGGFGATGNATVGTISVLNGNTLYVTTSSGALVKVTLDPSTTTITRNASTKSDDLRPGDTVVVQGTANASGTSVSATSIAATAPGVTSTRFGGGGSGFGGGGSGFGGTDTSNGTTTSSNGGGGGSGSSGGGGGFGGSGSGGSGFGG
jgi:hypothetical protein